VVGVAAGDVVDRAAAVDVAGAAVLSAPQAVTAIATATGDAPRTRMAPSDAHGVDPRQGQRSSRESLITDGTSELPEDRGRDERRHTDRWARASVKR
jgi:hypothetical protein